MQKCIDLSETFTFKGKDEKGVEETVLWTGEKFIRKFVLDLPYWRQGGLERVDCGLEIEAALDANPTRPVLSPDACSKLAEAFRMENISIQWGDGMGRYFKRIHRAVLTANEVKTEPKKNE